MNEERCKIIVHILEDKKLVPSSFRLLSRVLVTVASGLGCLLTESDLLSHRLSECLPNHLYQGVKLVREEGWAYL